jgi:DMSO/TMAO reductase YedYZ molybdopterin-dependent catalytic subunit
MRTIRSSWPYAVAAVLAALAGVGIGHLVAAWVEPAASPVVAVGATVIDATPTPVKEWAVSTFGTADKPILIGSVMLVTLLAAAGIGLVARRHRTTGLALLLGLVALAGLGGALRPAAGAFALVPSIVTAAVGLVAASLLWQSADRMQRPPTEPDVALGTPRAKGPDRRAFVLGAASTGAVAAAGGALGQAVVHSSSTASASLTLPTPTNTLAALPAGLETTVEGVAPFVTPTKDFYRIDTALLVPKVSTDDWSLTIDGEVDHGFRLTWAELLAMPMVEADITLCCVSNEVGGPYISAGRWLGVRTRDLLERAGVRTGADQILSTSTDGMTISTPVQALTDGRNALVAVALDGKPLPREHGFPARLVTPGLYGFVGATKWLTRMTATTYAREEAYWTQRGWATESPVLTQSRIDTPVGFSNYSAGRVVIGGVAWAQGRGIRGVEVRVDDGPWEPATLGPDGGIDYWRQWYHPWQATSGRHTLWCRATDLTGETQPETRADPFPRGATGWHNIVVNIA